MLELSRFSRPNSYCDSAILGDSCDFMIYIQHQNGNTPAWSRKHQTHLMEYESPVEFAEQPCLLLPLACGSKDLSH